MERAAPLTGGHDCNRSLRRPTLTGFSHLDQEVSPISQCLRQVPPTDGRVP